MPGYILQCLLIQEGNGASALVVVSRNFPFPRIKAPQRMAPGFILEFLSTLKETGVVLFGWFFFFQRCFSSQQSTDVVTFLPAFKLSMSYSCLQVMLLETSRRYNPEIESITFLKDLSYNRDDFAKAGGALDRCFFLPSVLCSYIFPFLMWAAGSSLW